MNASYLSLIPSDVGNHTLPQDWHVPPGLGLRQSSFYHMRPCYQILWPLVLGLQPVFFHHTPVPLNLSVKGKVLHYSRCLSEMAIACHRRSRASLGALR